jgi:hypothetical protein
LNIISKIGFSLIALGIISFFIYVFFVLQTGGSDPSEELNKEIRKINKLLRAFTYQNS